MSLDISDFRASVFTWKKQRVIRVLEKELLHDALKFMFGGKSFHHTYKTDIWFGGRKEWRLSK